MRNGEQARPDGITGEIDRLKLMFALAKPRAKGKGSRP
jgi:hypothetical protein